MYVYICIYVYWIWFYGSEIRSQELGIEEGDPDYNPGMACLGKKTAGQVHGKRATVRVSERARESEGWRDGASDRAIG